MGWRWGGEQVEVGRGAGGGRGGRALRLVSLGGPLVRLQAQWLWADRCQDGTSSCPYSCQSHSHLATGDLGTEGGQRASRQWSRDVCGWQPWRGAFPGDQQTQPQRWLPLPTAQVPNALLARPRRPCRESILVTGKLGPLLCFKYRPGHIPFLLRSGRRSPQPLGQQIYSSGAGAGLPLLPLYPAPPL